MGLTLYTAKLVRSHKPTQSITSQLKDPSSRLESMPCWTSKKGHMVLVRHILKTFWLARTFTELWSSLKPKRHSRYSLGVGHGCDTDEER
jgi:hypothetical protein